jgi:uncharacterized membrane protein YccC
VNRVTQFKEAIKISLAITIAYYVAMRFSWMSSTWPAIAVAFISLPTAGQSIGKGMLRIGGTLLAFVVGLFYLGLFPQERWYFFLAFTPYLAFITYKMTGKDGQYFWFCAAFVSMMIIKAGPQEGSAFHFAAYRTMETIVGVVIWTVVSVFIWPRSSRKSLYAVSRKLLEAQEKLLDGLRDELLNRGTGEGLKMSRAQAGKLAGQLGQTIAAAASESYEVKEVRHLWERAHGLSVSMLEVLDRLQSGLDDLKKIDIQPAADDLEGFFSALDARLREAYGTLGGEPPGVARAAILSSFRAPELEGLNHFQRATVEVTRTELEQLESLTRALLECVRDLEGYETGEVGPVVAVGSSVITGPFGLPPLDPDRVRATIMVAVSMWSASLIWIYFNPPGHSTWYQFVPNMALVAAQTPQMRFRLLKPMAYAYMAALVVYVFLMPHLSTFWQLGPLIFTFSFVAAYFFTGVARAAIYLSVFNMLGISNQQTYSFANQANTLVFTLLGVMLVVVLTYITRSPRPEKAFMSMLSRFFRSCEFFVSPVADSAGIEPFRQRMKRAFYLQELRSLPAKLGLWGAQIDHTKFPHNAPDQVQEIVSNVQMLASRIEELLKARRLPQAEVLVKELSGEAKAWRLVFEQALRNWSEKPEAESAEDLRAALSARINRLDDRIEETINRAAEGERVDEKNRNFYQLLGAYRGVSKAAIAYAEIAGTIEWGEWREERF